MDLKHDWRALNEVLFARTPEDLARDFSGDAKSLVVLEGDGVALDGVVSSGEKFVERGSPIDATNKAGIDALGARYGAEQTLVLSRAEIDQVVSEAAALGPNYYQQLELIRERLTSRAGKRGRGDLVLSKRHFVMDLFSGFLRRFLPKRFHVLVFIDQRPFLGRDTTAFSYKAALLAYSAGKLEEFYEPDFSSLYEGRLPQWGMDPVVIGQYLESRYLQRCYGIFLFREDWEACLRASQHGASRARPWGQFLKSLDEGRAAIYPRSFVIKALLAVQRVIMYFSRL